MVRLSCSDFVLIEHVPLFVAVPTLLALCGRIVMVRDVADVGLVVAETMEILLVPLCNEESEWSVEAGVGLFVAATVGLLRTIITLLLALLALLVLIAGLDVKVRIGVVDRVVA